VVAAVAVTVTLLVRGGGGTASQAGLGPVILIPGYGGSVDDLDPLVAQLRREDRTPVVFTPSGGGIGDLRVQARRLADLTQRTLARTEADSVDLIGYSAGGVIARLYVRDDGGASVVRRVLTLGSPHHGTDLALLAQQVAGSCPTACEQLATGSDLLRQLNAGDETPDGPRWVTVRSEVDRIVTPSVSAELEGAINIDVQQVCPGSHTSHGGLPEDPVVQASVASALGTSAPMAPDDVTC
jgi:triacylglycerol lipase